MKAMILAAGRGERMRPLTDHTPKPLLKVGGKPLIVWHLERLARAGFKEIVINHAHLGAQIEEALGNGAAWGLSIAYSPEKVALETAGGIANALHLLGSEPFLVINGDIYTEIDLKNTALQANTHAGAGHALKLAHLVLVDNPPQHPNGDFAIEEGMLKNEGGKNNSGMLTFSGVGVYHPDLFADVVIGQPAKLAPLLRRAIDNNVATAQYYQGVWRDIGTPERLALINNIIDAKRFFNNVPQEVFDIWLTEFIEARGWPPVGVNWDSLLGGYAPSEWQSFKWEKVLVDLSQVRWSEQSIQVIKGLADARFGKIDNAYQNIENSDIRMKNIHDYIKKTRKLPGALILIKDDAWVIIDGCHRMVTYAGWIQDNEFKNKIERSQLAWIATPA